jgi:ATP-binding cassette, subfamily B, multidrug efflux pump
VPEQAASLQEERRIVWRMLRYAWPFRAALSLALVLLALASAIQLLGPLFTQLVIDHYLIPASTADFGRFSAMLLSWLPREKAVGVISICMLWLVAIIVRLACEAGQEYLLQRTGQSIMFAVRRQLFGHLQTLDIAWFDHNPVGRNVTRVTTDVDALNEFFSAGLVAMLGDLMMLSFLTVAMLRMNWNLTLTLLAVMPIVIGASAIFRRHVSRDYRAVRASLARINSYLQEQVSGMSVVQLMNHEARSVSEFDERNREQRDAQKASILAYGWFYPVTEFAGVLALALLLAQGGAEVAAGSVTLGMLVAFFQYGQRFFGPVQDLSEKYNTLQSAIAAAERIFALLDTKARVVAPVAPLHLPATAELAIEFDHVWFAYKDEDWVLRDVSFRIAPGETIAIVGFTGAGKSTIIALLQRFYDVQRGAIRIGGVDVQDMDPVELRRALGVVLQDAFLFSGSLRDNIRLGNDAVPDEAIMEAARAVNLSEWLGSLAGGLDGPVRERGAGLSAGQKQLISFARALVHRPRILVLDEATSSVDTETELHIRSALERMVSGRTSILIAHRLSTVQRASRIFVMHHGQLRESGPHQELLAQRGLYWKLYQLQYRDQDLNPSSPRLREA